MNKKIFITITAIFSYLLPIFVFAQNNVSQSVSEQTILTVNKVGLNLTLGTEIQLLDLIDEKGDTIGFQGDTNQWFENAVIKDVILPKGSSITYKPGSKMFILNDGSNLLIKFIVNEKVYDMHIKNGSKLVTQKTSNGKYILLPEK